MMELLKELKLDDYRQTIGFVSQDVFLLDGTVLENIIYGKHDATDEEIIIRFSDSTEIPEIGDVIKIST